MRIGAALAAFLGLSLVLAPPAASETARARPVLHEALSRALDDLARELHGLESRWREHFHRDARGERPLISLMLQQRDALALTPAQVEALERLRADYRRDAIRREAERRIVELDLAALLDADAVDLAQVEAKVRELERLRADQRLARIRTIERGKAELTSEQRARLQTLLAEPAPPHAGRPPSRDRL